MSSSTLYRIYRTRATAVASYRNAYGCARPLWTALAERFLGCDYVALRDTQPLWDLSVDPRVPAAWRLTLEFTFDRWVCPPALLTTLAGACEEVGAGLTTDNHWRAIGASIRQEATRTDHRLIGIGLGCTSLCDPWDEWRPATDPIYVMESSTIQEPV